MTVAHNGQELRIEAIRQHVTIFEVFDRMGLQVSPETQQMLCPFHPDTTPSARVFAEQNKIHCWTCQRGWDVIDAVMTHWNLPFHDAIVFIEDEFSVPGGIQSLRGAIRTRLAAKATVDVKAVVDQVERGLAARRQQLGFERYTRLLQALDLTVYDHTQKALPPAVVQERMVQILQAAR